MPRRWGITTRTWVYRFLVQRDGEQCARCFKNPTTQNALDIDHINGITFDSDPDNLRLLCRSCNVTLGNKSRSPTAQNTLPSAQRERERQEGKAATRVVRQEVDYKQGEVTMQANFLFEVDFRNWLLNQVRELGHYSKSDAIAAGAELVGCSPLTTSRYLAKLVSSSGPLEEVRDMLGNWQLQMKDHLREAPRTIIDLDAVAHHQGEKGKSDHRGPDALRP